jgi:6-phosphogluconolactonase
MTRISLTFPVINAAKDVLFLSLGPDKASVVKEVVTGKHDPERLPAQYVHPEPGRATWLLDPPAAAGLPEDMLNRK